MYNKINENDIKKFIDIAGEDRVFYGESINEDYSHDEMPEYGLYMPEAVIEILSAKEASAILSYCNERRIPVTPRGSGTGLAGGAVAKYGGIIVSTVRMNKILGFDLKNLTVTVEPGVLLMELAEAALKKDLLYPPDPGEKSATLGGNVMTNAGGMRAIKYGVTREYVRSMEVVLANGDIVTFGSNVAKDSSGYSLKNIMIGSEGTLGLVTKLTLELIPLPKLSVSLLVPFNTLGECIDAVPMLLEHKMTPTALEFMQREVICAAEEYLGKIFPSTEYNNYLIITFDGNSKNEIDAVCGEACEICLSCGAIDVFICDTDERKDSVWSARGAFLEAIKSSTSSIDECDVVVPRDKIAEFVKFVGTLEEEHGIRIRSFGHAGDGNIHIYACKDELSDSEWTLKLKAVMDAMYEAAYEMGGRVSGEHGIGHAKLEFLKNSVGERNMELMRGIKEVFDPFFILNPGKVYGDI